MPDKSPEGGLNPVERITLSSEHSDRKRKLRKGTASCWECKHRKKRCTYQPASPAECDSCLRLGLTCVNQGLPDPTDHRYDKVRQRIVHVEALVEQLLRQRNRQSTQSSSTPNTGTKLPKPAILDHSSCPTLRSVGHERLSRGRSLTAYLESMFPNPAICAVILSSSKLFSSPLQIDQGPGNSQPVNYPGKDPIIPSNSHPLEFARRLVQLALCLKQFDAPSAQQFQKHLGEPVPIVAQRFSNVANHYVLSQDYLIASLEGIETLILQTRWYATVGNFRIACEIHRRATRIALSINILKLIETDYRAEKIWFHLVYSDRFLSLMLGIPSASTNDAFAHPSRLAINSPDEKMERIHTLLAGQLISRNLRIQEATSEQQKGSLILARIQGD
ncbi:hypothetical protein N7468_002469 [Penicillium chermesinum]|uniref:Zn(2)-C6 fungal-type domain-containing protein n=1 Tax=Penicillium chermesinum TaxID=63820 RepID=A0A9W9PIJ8_9EURO|nr:uncharacterized protein N7468_002469 [Penicillium chermesinum]KAJ5247486.1 hypothetical protein N7468_002469 [Penicillium chermesinum]